MGTDRPCLLTILTLCRGMRADQGLRGLVSGPRTEQSVPGPAHETPYPLLLSWKHFLWHFVESWI